MVAFRNLQEWDLLTWPGCGLNLTLPILGNTADIISDLLLRCGVGYEGCGIVEWSTILGTSQRSQRLRLRNYVLVYILLLPSSTPSFPLYDLATSGQRVPVLMS